MTATVTLNFSAISATLCSSLQLQHPPIAISFCDSLPADVPVYSGRVPAGCRFWEDAAASVFATTATDHCRCAIGVYTHNLEPSIQQQTDLIDALKVFGDLGYVRAEDLPQIPVLQSKPKYVLYSPLARSPLEPSLILLFVKASQTLILSEAAQQTEGRGAPAMGRPACAIVPQVVNSGSAALSLGCCGARAYLDALTDDVAIFAIPGPKLAIYAERIEALANANNLLSQFHRIRRHAVDAGQNPTVRDSLAAISG